MGLQAPLEQPRKILARKRSPSGACGRWLRTAPRDREHGSRRCGGARALRQQRQFSEDSGEAPLVRRLHVDIVGADSLRAFRELVTVL